MVQLRDVLTRLADNYFKSNDGAGGNWPSPTQGAVEELTQAITPLFSNDAPNVLADKGFSNEQEAAIVLIAGANALKNGTKLHPDVNVKFIGDWGEDATDKKMKAIASYAMSAPQMRDGLFVRLVLQEVIPVKIMADMRADMRKLETEKKEIERHFPDWEKKCSESKFSEVQHHLERAASLGHVFACIWLLHTYYTDCSPEEQPLQKDENFYKSKVVSHVEKIRIDTPQGLYYMGFCALHGIGIDQRLGVAAEFFKRAAEGNYLDADSKYKSYHSAYLQEKKEIEEHFPDWEKKCSESNFSEVQHHLEMAASHGHVYACIWLLHMHYMHKSLEKQWGENYKVKLMHAPLEKDKNFYKSTVARHVKNLIGLDSPQDLYYLGFCALHGIGIEQSYKMASEFFRRSAKDGYLNAEDQSCRCALRASSDVEEEVNILLHKGLQLYLEGEHEEAALPLREAAEAGNSYACVLLLSIQQATETIDIGDAEKYKALIQESKSTISMHAHYQYKDACFYLAICHEEGIVFEKDTGLAEDNYKISAEGKFAPAQYRYGRFCMRLGLAEEDLEKQTNYLKKAVENLYIASDREITTAKTLLQEFHQSADGKSNRYG